jgi:pyruvate/2-oxoglutarate dehydrogenase complex dihydrolipoamide acyltransferase (E2) component
MPHEVRLRFGTYGTVQKIYVEKGDRVKAGTLLARLDNSSQKKAIAKALMNVQLAYNQISTITCCRVMGYPRAIPIHSADPFVPGSKRNYGCRKTDTIRSIHGCHDAVETCSI